MLFGVLLVVFAGCKGLYCNAEEESQLHEPGIGKPDIINSFGTTTQNFRMDVLQKPSITEFENITIAVDTEAILTCKAKGRPAPSITFRRYGWEFVKSEYGPYSDVIPSQVVDEEMGETIATLTFRALSWYYGNYECLANNTVDSVIQTAYVTIEFPPNLGYPENPPAYSYKGRPVNFTCAPRALPEANIDFYWNDKLINDLDDQHFLIIKSGSQSTLVVEPVDDSYFTTYKCVASNKHGQANRTMEIRNAYPPEAIADVKARSWSAESIYFEVKASLTGTPPQFYTYQYKEEAEVDWIDSINSTLAVLPVTTVSVQGLKQNTDYNFRFYAENELGTSPFKELSHKTMCQYSYTELKLLNKITDDRAEEEIPFFESPYTDKIELIWEAIIEPCEETIVYTIEYCLASHSNWKSIAIVAGQCVYVQGITNTNYVIQNLTAETYYAIRVNSRFSFSSSYHFMRTARDPVTGGDARLKIYPTYSVQGLAVGTSFNFSCKSKAESFTNLSWRDSYNNPVDTKSSESIMYTEVVNDGEIMLVIPFVKHTMYGTYYCTASKNSDIIETFVKIETYILISGSEKFDYRLGFAGHTGYVSCRFYVETDANNTNIEWFFDNNPIQPSDRYEFRTDEYVGYYPEYNLIIHNITDADEGFYTCRQSLNQRQIYLEVVTGPSILNSETEYSAVLGNDVVIDCQTSGKPAPSVKWVNESEEDVSLNNRFSVSRFGQMKITSVQENDNGNYICKAYSLAGMSEKTFQLNVKPN